MTFFRKYTYLSYIIKKWLRNNLETELYVHTYLSFYFPQRISKSLRIFFSRPWSPELLCWKYYTRRPAITYFFIIFLKNEGVLFWKVSRLGARFLQEKKIIISMQASKCSNLYLSRRPWNLKTLIKVLEWNGFCLQSWIIIIVKIFTVNNA